MKKYLLIAAIAAAAYLALAPSLPARQATPADSTLEFEQVDGGDAALEYAYSHHLGNQRVAGQGTVVKILPDDTQGSQHQRFIIRLASGRTLLVAHNIDLANRIDALRVGEPVAFAGEYEWNPKGGVIHWTHRDPHGRHPAGWIKYDSQTYQ